MSAQVASTVIVGAGLVGAAIAFGLRRRGNEVLVLDDSDRAPRASQGNFGLIWVQGKGAGLPAYGNWTQRSARDWPQLAAELLQETGIDVALRQRGGLHVCATADEFDARRALLTQLQAQPGFERYEVDLLDHAGVAQRLPGVGPTIAGGSFCALDGDCNPLRLLRALHAALDRAGVTRRTNAQVASISPRHGGFRVRTHDAEIDCAQVVLAAGLGNAVLAPMVGLHAPLHPNQGQIIVTERLRPLLPVPLETMRQTDDGTILIGDSQQDVGLDLSQDPAIMALMAARALAVLPALRDVGVNRAWSALRVMSPDGFPIYAQSTLHPGAFVVTCHSGVTLAAAHAYALAPAIASGTLASSLSPFNANRFDVPAAA